MNSVKRTAVAVAIGAVSVGSVYAVTNHDDLFGYTEMSSGYQLVEHEGKCGEGKCGEGKCGEGKCGEGKCGEGKCGGSKGSSMKAHEAACGEGNCGSSR